MIAFSNFWHIIGRYFRLLFKQAMRPVRPGAGGAMAPEATLHGLLIRADGSKEKLGILSTKLVTDAFVAFLVDQMQASTGQVANFKFHGSGTGIAAESATDIALGTEVESRATGTQEEGASANIYKTVGTVAYTATRAITEHGLFDATTGGTLCDRSVFAAVNVNNGDSIQFSYELTFPSGG